MGRCLVRSVLDDWVVTTNLNGTGLAVELRLGSFPTLQRHYRPHDDALSLEQLEAMRTLHLSDATRGREEDSIELCVAGGLAAGSAEQGEALVCGAIDSVESRHMAWRRLGSMNGQ